MLTAGRQPLLATRISNFAAGPATLPLSVLEQVRDELPCLPGHGMSIVEMGHRSPVVERMVHDTEASIRRIANVPGDYDVLFLAGGARLQFALMPMNVLAPGACADYIDTGIWSLNAIKEAAAVGDVRVAASGKSNGYRRLPSVAEWTLSDGASYVHITSNNTVEGTQFHELPPTSGVPLIIDATSDVFSRPIDIGRIGALYAAAQKNLGVAGVTLLIIRRDLHEQNRRQMPNIFRYAVHAATRSSYSTPPVFAIYVMKLVMGGLESNGGLAGIEVLNRRKAALLYAELDRSGFYQPCAARECRSLMNVTFRLAHVDREREFIAEADRQGLSGLAGHPAAGGIRASLYNGLPEEAVTSLVAFMREFERTHG
jgi:phosphoserine aminotransferase